MFIVQIVCVLLFREARVNLLIFIRFSTVFFLSSSCIFNKNIINNKYLQCMASKYFLQFIFKLPFLHTPVNFRVQSSRSNCVNFPTFSFSFKFLSTNLRFYAILSTILDSLSFNNFFFILFPGLFTFLVHSQVSFFFVSSKK